MASNIREICTICQSRIRNNSTTLPCKHSFCASCVKTYINSQPFGAYRCPNCRECYTKESEAAGVSNETLTGWFCMTCDVPVYVYATDLHEKHTTKFLGTTACRLRSDFLALKQRVYKAFDEAHHALETTEGAVKTFVGKLDKLEDSINKRHDSIVRAAERSRENTLKSLRLCNNTVCAKNEETIKNLQKRLEKLDQVKAKIEDALMTGDENVSIDEWMSKKKVDDDLIGPQRPVTLVSPVLCSEEEFPKVRESIGMFIGSVKTTPVNLVIPELKPVKMFDTEAVSEDFCDLRSFRCLDNGQKGGLVISYATEEKNVAVQVSDSAQIIERIENSEVERYSRIKVFEGGEPMLPILDTGMSSSFSKTTKSTHYRLNSGDEGRGEILQINLAASNPLVVKSRSVRKIMCGHHRSFDVDENGKMFVVLEEAQTAGDSRKVRLFKRNSSYPVATYQPPQQPFQPTDLVLYNLNGERVLLVADGATDKIHVIGFKDKRLMFLRYLAVEACLLSQPCVLEIDVHNRLWVACRDGKVFGFACSPVADAEANSPTECSPRRSFGLTAAAKPAARQSLKACCLLPFGTIPTTEI